MTLYSEDNINNCLYYYGDNSSVTYVYLYYADNATLLTFTELKLKLLPRVSLYYGHNI